MTTLTRVELRDLARIDGWAREVMRQTEFLRRNMAEQDTHDRIRFLVIQSRARNLLAVAERCGRRYMKAHP